MSAEQDPSKEQQRQETSALLQRVLSVVERDDRSQRLEIVVAALLGLATVTSAWCAYQATLWSGAQTFRLAAADHAGRESTEQALAAFQLRASDVQVLIAYLEARFRGDEEMMEFLHARFRPEARTALDAWLKLEPFGNPNAPGPFQMAEYAQPELQAAKRLDEERADLLNAAQHASKTSDSYVLLTVLFASVLFFGGISGTFRSQRSSISVIVIAVVLFCVTLIALGTLPICRE